MKNLTLISAVLALGLTATTNIMASTIVYDGEDANIGAGWRDSSVTKAYSVSGSNVYGLDGYFTSTSAADAASTDTTITNALPTYVTHAATDSQTYAGGGYEAIDDPTTTSPYFNGLVYSGTDYVNGAAPGATDNLLTFTLSSTATIPNDIRIGVMVDNTDNSANQNPRPTLTLSGGTLGTATTQINAENGVADWYFFDITGAAAGDVYNISETNTSPTANENLQAGLISFDTVTAPEPSACVLMAVGSIALVFTLRRRNLASSI